MVAMRIQLGLVRLALNPRGLSEFKSQVNQSSSDFFPISSNSCIIRIIEQDLNDKSRRNINCIAGF
jgi:hypothetical protein